MTQAADIPVTAGPAIASEQAASQPKLVRTAILFITGYGQKERFQESYGLYTLRDTVAEKFWDRRRTWLGIRSWDGDLEYEADEIIRIEANKIIVVSYSWGSGRGLFKFANRLHSEHQRMIDLALMIDPVVYAGVGRLASQALFPGDGDFKLPENIRKFASWRTVNWKFDLWSPVPWGRDVDGGTAECLGRCAFGSAANLVKYRPQGERITADDVTHTNIDNNQLVHDGVMRLLEAAIVT